MFDTNCNFRKLKQNMLNMISEQQLKLGYMKETVRLYYLEKPLRRILEIEELNESDSSTDDINQTPDQIIRVLNEFTAAIEKEIGHIDIIPEKGRFCFVFSPEVSEYVHEHIHEQVFLKDLIEGVMRHQIKEHAISDEHTSDNDNHDGSSQISNIIDIFRKYSKHVYVEDVREKDMDFDYLVYFEDGIPDDMYYCLTDEGCHVTYHRYMKEDYLDIFGQRCSLPLSSLDKVDNKENNND